MWALGRSRGLHHVVVDALLAFVVVLMHAVILMCEVGPWGTPGRSLVHRLVVICEGRVLRQTPAIQKRAPRLCLPPHPPPTPILTGPALHRAIVRVSECVRVRC